MNRLHKYLKSDQIYILIEKINNHKGQLSLKEKKEILESLEKAL